MENGIITVKQSLKRMIGGGLVISKPKTKSSIRSIRIGIESIDVLNGQMKNLEIKKMNNKDLWQDKDFVFPSTIGSAMDPSGLVKKFKLSLKEAGLSGIRFHDLRHTSAALMLNNGVDVLVAQRRLGHAKPSITLDVYGHLLVCTQEKVANRLDDLIKQ